LVGTVAEVLETTLHKLKSTMMNLGADNLSSFREQAVITLVSEQSIVEAGTSNVFKFSRNRDVDESDWGN
jgi:IMP dehydrogenase/GMP reductase